MTAPTPTNRLGIIAGSGAFPFMVARGAKKAGQHVTIIALRGFADPALAEVCDDFYWSGLAKTGRWVRLLKRQRAKAVMLAGAVKKSSMYGRFRMLRLLPDLTAIKIWFFRLQDKRNDAVLGAVADEFGRHGIIMQDCIQYSAEDMAPEGVLTRGQPTDKQRRDADFGWTLAKEMGRLDIGQSIAVKETEVIAVEAIEGTDRMIDRAGELCAQGGWTMIKVSKPDQDMRFDVPTVGPDTIAKLKACGAKQLVIEAGKTLIVDRPGLIAAADKAGIVVDSRRSE